MFLRIPTSMIIPEILERLEDADFEEWLTALFIENASQCQLHNVCASKGYPSTVASADLWMVEITERTGKVWKGKFQVEFTEERRGNSNAMPRTENRYGELGFALDTESAEIVLKTDFALGSQTILPPQLLPLLEGMKQSWQREWRTIRIDAE